MVKEAVEDGGGDDAVVVEDGRPVFEGLVGGEDDGALFVALTDDLEEQVGAEFVDGQEAELVDDEKRRAKELGEFLVEAVGLLCGGEGVDDVSGGGEEGAMALEASLVAQGDGEVGFAEADAAEKDDVVAVLEEVEAEEVLDGGPVDFAGPAPVELIEGFEDGEVSGLDAAFGGAVHAQMAFAFEEAGEELEVGPAVLGGLCGQGVVVFADPGELEVKELIDELIGEGLGLHRGWFPGVDLLAGDRWRGRDRAGRDRGGLRGG